MAEDLVGSFGHANNSDRGSVGVEERGVTLPLWAGTGPRIIRVTGVSTSDTERSYVPVENPADRPRTTRETVRVILIDHDRTLLFEDSDPGVPDARWWVTPGGGVDPGETVAQAAIREVLEETGCRLTEDDLRGPIARRHVVHGYSDQVIEQDESFYLAMVAPFEVDISAHTADERAHPAAAPLVVPRRPAAHRRMDLAGRAGRAVVAGRGPGRLADRSRHPGGVDRSRHPVTRGRLCHSPSQG